MDEKKVVIELDNVKRNFIVGDETVHALRGVSFKIYEGEFVTIMGKSGSGNPLCSISSVVLTHQVQENIILTEYPCAICQNPKGLCCVTER